MNSYYSLTYALLFLPVTMIIYQLTSAKRRWIILLAASYVFFWSISGRLLFYIVFSSLSIHHFGLWFQHFNQQLTKQKTLLDKKQYRIVERQIKTRKRYVLLLALVIHLGMLVGLKYAPFFAENINVFFRIIRLPLALPVTRWLLPIGISFYTLQAVSYLVDVYRGVAAADDHLGRLALYLSFFPQIMEGPICRYTQTAQALFAGKSITYSQLTFGIQRILFGLMKKMVIADRLNPLVKEIFSHYDSYPGAIIFLGAVAYTIQLYMEFSGTMDIVIATAEIFGIRLPENFRQPFFSRTISEFWKRWHITLGTWFKDYVFYPVSMSRFSKKLTVKARKKIGHYYGPLLVGAIALLAVWLCNGFWHGVGWNYIFFGLYHFALILAGNLLLPFHKKMLKKMKIDSHHKLYQGMQIVRTFVFVCIGELFFRADGLRTGMKMFYRMITSFASTAVPSDMLFYLGVDRQDVMIVLVAVLIVFIISVFKEKKYDLRKTLASKPIPVRWAVYYMLILMIVIFGAYGSGYVPVDPMYAQF